MRICPTPQPRTSQSSDSDLTSAVKPGISCPTSSSLMGATSVPAGRARRVTWEGVRAGRPVPHPPSTAPRPCRAPLPQTTNRVGNGARQTTPTHLGSCAKVRRAVKGAVRQDAAVSCSPTSRGPCCADLPRARVRPPWKFARWADGGAGDGGRKQALHRGHRLRTESARLVDLESLSGCCA